ncbi:hypothetical protein D3C78_775680 [compost metagenome]
MLVDALETGDHHYATGLEVGADVGVVDAQDTRLGVRAVGEDAHLVAGIGNRRHAALEQGHAEQRDGDLLAGGDHDIQLTRNGLVHDLFGQTDQAVGFAAHGGNHHDDIVAVLAEFLHLLGYLLDTLDSAD